MTDEKRTPPDIRLLVVVQASDSFGDHYLKFTGHIQVMAPDGLHSPGSYATDYRAPELEGLQVTAQRDPSSRDFYGWSVNFQPYKVALDDAERMVRVLRKAERRMTALTVKYGAPADLPAFAAYLMSDLATCERPYIRRVAHGEPDFEGTGYRTMSVEDLRHWLASQVTEWQKAHGITASA